MILLFSWSYVGHASYDGSTSYDGHTSYEGCASYDEHALWWWAPIIWCTTIIRVPPFWGKKCMMDRHHISQLINHHFPIKQNCHHGYIKVVSCPTRSSTIGQKSIAWQCADIKQSNRLIYQKILLANGWMVWILKRKWEEFPDVTLVNRDDNRNEAHKIILSKMKLKKVKVTYDITESRSQTIIVCIRHVWESGVGVFKAEFRPAEVYPCFDICRVVNKSLQIKATPPILVREVWNWINLDSLPWSLCWFNSRPFRRKWVEWVSFS